MTLRAIKDEVSIFPNINTKVWRVTGEVEQGRDMALPTLPDTYLGPTLRAKKGETVRIHFENQLDEESILHWHGLHVPADMDGHPQFAVGPGESYQYEFEIRNRAGTYWYHPHPHGRTGPQVYAGMAGFFLVSDEEETNVNLPSGEYDVPLALQDRTFDQNGQLVYIGNGMIEQMNGFLGNQLLVNGKPDFVLPVATRAYRLCLLNGSNSRIYKLGWEDETPLTVIGTDGGLLEKPVQRSYITLAPAERIELWVDFKGRVLGSELKLVSLPFNAGSFESGLFPVLTVQIDQETTDNVPLPSHLSDPGFFSANDATRTRTVALQMEIGRGWTLNGRTFEMTGVTPAETIPLNALEIWEFKNEQASRGGMMGGGMMNMSLPHPIHMHGESFQVIERTISDGGKAAWETLSEGFVDEGWKDTVLVMPGEQVEVLRRFGDYTGLFIYHCHNLEHEDMGMMRNFRIDAPE
jgi:FtsP/CotA-like multicopper oxidase with cupredoxin domain